MSYKAIPLKQQGMPWRGIISDYPPPLDPAAFTDAQNFLFRMGRIQTRPKFNAFLNTPDGARVRYLITFQDVTNLYHTLMLTSNNAYMLTNPPPTWNLLGYPGGITNLSGTALPFNAAQILNAVYFANGSVPVLYSDGEATLKVAGNVPGSALFVAENQQTLILAATTEPAPGQVNSTFFPRRVRFSANGLPNQWDPSVDFSAGANDLVEVPDVITGLGTLGRNTYVWRTNGISTMYPTGIGTAPFAFEHFSIGLQGNGNIFPYSLDIFDNKGYFISADTVRMFDGSATFSITTGKIRKRIYANLTNATTDMVTGRVLPNMGPDFPYLAYWINIPGPNVSWVYNIDEDNWTTVTSSKAFITALNLVSVGS